jgi:hemolysin III
MEKQLTDLRIRQELVNSLTHGFGMIFGIIGIPVLIALATNSHHIAGIVGASVYGFCFLMLFTFSTLYHGFQQPRVKEVLQVFDHISIYFLIAGTYTPFLLIYMFNAFGITLLSILWGLTILGIIFKIFLTGKFEILSTLIYLAMGWIMIVGGRTFFSSIPPSVMVMIIIGGGLYSIGVIFYLWEKYTYNHAVWHLLVLAAAICHYVAILLAV